MSIWRRLGLDRLAGSDGDGDELESTPGATETVRKIVSELDRLEPTRARYIAAFAYLLSRVAYADRDISPAEVEAMERIVREQGHLPEEQAILVVQMAKTQSVLFGGTENFLVTREFKEMSTMEQRVELLHCIFGVAAADRSITSVEEIEIRQIASELGIDHRALVAARIRHKAFLEVLRRK